MSFRERIDGALERAGYSVQPAEKIRLLEASDQDRRSLQKELDLLGWSVLDHFGGNEHEVKVEERRKMAKQARMVWLQDPLVGAAVDLQNDFVFGRGIPAPRAKDEKVQEILDEAWRDTDTQAALTSYAAQMALGVDLALQCNLFILFFEGDDGKVKVSLLDHDAVETVVPNPENRLLPLYYVVKQKPAPRWDYKADKQATDMPNLENGKPKVVYYEHVTNVEKAIEEGVDFDKPPKEKLGEGRVYHIAINRTSGMVFGVPSMRRLTRFASALNEFLAARVDLMKASAALIMKRKVTGTPAQVARLAAKAISRRSDLAATIDPETEMHAAPAPGSIITENQGVSHEQLSLNTNAANAQTDASIIRAQVAAATRFPQHYLGSAENANLATATSMELPVTKKIEGLQEIFEQLYRFFFDKCIENAVDGGRLSKELEPEEREDEPAVPEAEAEAEANGKPQFGKPAPAKPFGKPPKKLQGAAGEDQAEDEEETERDLSYEFSMPNPLKRAMTDLINSASTVAKTFDPNGTNLELSKVLLTIILGEGFELPEPSETVERVFPDDYEDPALKMQQEQFEMQKQIAQQQGGFPGADGQQHDEENPYGAPQKSLPPEKAMKKQKFMQQAQFEDLPLMPREEARRRRESFDDLYQREVGGVLSEELTKLLIAPGGSNGDGG